MTWHLDQVILAPYLAGRLGDVASDSVEAHLVACQECRLSVEIDADRKDRLWSEVLDLTLVPTVGRSERLLRRFGISPPAARLIGMTPSIRRSWLVSVMLVATMALVASQNLDGGPVLLLLVAPLVPVVGVAASFGRQMDPLYEVGLASPTGAFRLMLIRTVAVLGASILAMTVPALAFAQIRWAAACLLPALALTLLTLLLASVTSTSRAAGLVSLLWIAAVVAAERGPNLDSFDQPPAQAAFGLLVVVLGAAILAQRPAFEHKRISGGPQDG